MKRSFKVIGNRLSSHILESGQVVTLDEILGDDCYKVSGKFPYGAGYISQLVHPDDLEEIEVAAEVKLTVTYFKNSGKYYMTEEVTIPNSFLAIIADNRDDAKVRARLAMDFRNWLTREIVHDEFIAVVIPDEKHQPDIFNLLGFPLMVMPKAVKD